MINPKQNTTKYSLANKPCPPVTGPENQYTSTKKLSKASTNTSDNRVSAFKLENK
jgi:hypothetical protein